MRAARGDAGLEDTVDVSVMAAVDGVAKAGSQQPRRARTDTRGSGPTPDQEAEPSRMRGLLGLRVSGRLGGDGGADESPEQRFPVNRGWHVALVEAR